MAKSTLPAVTSVMTQPAQSPAVSPPAAPARSKEPMKGVVVRLTEDQWYRIKELALKERTTIQALALDGFSDQLTKRGMKPL